MRIVASAFCILRATGKKDSERYMYDYWDIYYISGKQVYGMLPRQLYCFCWYYYILKGKIQELLPGAVGGRYIEDIFFSIK